MDVAERFEGLYQPEPNTGCWIWVGTMDQTNGYGRFRWNGRSQNAHRFAYEVYKGPIPKGAHIDHLCRTRSCVNPSHLEAVTPRENLMRGNTLAAQNAEKTHCKNGHALEGDNVYWHNRDNGMRRYCKKCQRARQAAYQKRRKDLG